jgi:hypothetical protein
MTSGTVCRPNGVMTHKRGDCLTKMRLPGFEEHAGHWIR